jgi:hypothetical protein
VDALDQMPSCAPRALTGAAPEPPRGAIFVSYAEEDLDAAKRLKAGLDSAGLDVWFDKSELQGGDTWSLKNHQQHKSMQVFPSFDLAKFRRSRLGLHRIKPLEEILPRDGIGG